MTINNESLNLQKTILSNLKSNGFPLKKVSLPMDKLYEVADNRGVNLNKILSSLKEKEGILNKKDGDRIVFSQINLNRDSKDSKKDFMKQAQDMMGQMTPEQIKSIQDEIQAMSSKEKSDLMDQAKKMGIS